MRWSHDSVLTALAVLIEDMGLVPAATWQLTMVTTVPGDPTPSSASEALGTYVVNRHICRQNIYTYISVYVYICIVGKKLSGYNT